MFFVENTEDLFYRKWLSDTSDFHKPPESPTNANAMSTSVNYRRAEPIPFTTDTVKSSTQKSDTTWYEIAPESAENHNSASSLISAPLSRKEKFRSWLDSRLFEVSGQAASPNSASSKKT